MPLHHGLLGVRSGTISIHLKNASLIQMRKFILIVLTIIQLSGCIFIPTSGNKVLEGQPVEDKQLVFLTPGITSKDMVVNQFGKPNLIWIDACTYVYHWKMRQGILIWSLGAPGAGSVDDIPIKHALLLQFDDQDKLIRFEKAIRPTFQSYGKFLEEWISDSPSVCNLNNDV